jgi:cobalamin biosynthesis Mg chelatase CobN
MAMKKQQGSITTALLVILTVIGLLVWAYGTTTVSPEDVQAVVQKAKTSPAATAIIQSALKKTPTPTVTELVEIRDKVNEQLVLDISKSATGEASLQPSSVRKEEEKQKSAEQFTAAVDTPVVGWSIKVGLALVFIWIIIFAVRKTRS